ncbi:MAG: hypothetical protein QOF76_1569 [Solirubrobacteraceae bacterium]|nr:hypothetical protein [Solirubrobacteraceae bacterium]
MTRALAVAGALVVTAFFGLAVRQATSANAARERLVGLAPRSPAAAARTRTLIDHAGTLNPDRGIDVLRARLDFLQGQIAAGRRILLDVVADEPHNVEAWTALALAFGTLDPPLAARARDALDRLAPDVPEP